MVAVHVLIDLHWQKAVGGHVRSWLQFAEVAQKLEAEVELTLHFQGDRIQFQRVQGLQNVCFELLFRIANLRVNFFIQTAIRLVRNLSSHDPSSFLGLVVMLLSGNATN